MASKEKGLFLIFAALLVVSGRGASPSALSVISPSTTKIQHVIFIIQENHAFDNYFGTFPSVNGLNNAPPCCASSLDGAAIAGGYYGQNPFMIHPFHQNITKPVLIWGDELPPGLSDPDQLTNSTNSNSTIPVDVDPDDIPSQLLNSTTSYPIGSEGTPDMNHSWEAAHVDWNNGLMNGFIVGEKSADTMGYYDGTDIPYYWDYASNYVIDDNFFSSLMGPSFPNHLYIASGTNGPVSGSYSWAKNGGS